MENEKMFEFATRQKLRFNYRGVLSAEDLWDLTVEELDSIFKTLNSQLKSLNEDSLLSVKSPVEQELRLKVGIISHIVTVKLQEKEDRANAAAKRAQKDKILKVLASKQEEDLSSKSIEELQKMLVEINS